MHERTGATRSRCILAQALSHSRSSRVVILSVALLMLMSVVVPSFVSAQDNYTFGTQQVNKGVSVSPANKDTEDGSFNTLSESDQYADTNYSASSESMVTGTAAGGAFPASLDTDDATRRNYVEANSAPANYQYVLAPTGDSAIAWTAVFPTTPTTHWDKVDDRGTASDTDYVQTATASTVDIYTMSDLPTPSGTPSYDVTAWAQAKDSSSGTNRFQVGIRISTTNYLLAYVNPGTSYANYSIKWTTNPATSAEWTITQIQALLGVITPNTDATPAPRCTQMGITVDVIYTASYAVDAQVTYSNVLSSAQTTGYQVLCQGYRSGSENFDVQVWNYTSSAWVTKTTIQAAADTDYNFNLVGWSSNCERSSGNEVKIRIVDASGDSVQDTVYFDVLKIQRIEKGYALDVELTSTAVSAYGDIKLRIKGYTSAEQFNINIWNYTSAAYDTGKMAITSLSNTWQTTLDLFDNHYRSGQSVKIQIVDATAASSDLVCDTLYLDVAWVSLYHADPTITLRGASPSLVVSGQAIIFFANYTDYDNEAPSFMYVNIDSSNYAMSKNNTGDASYYNGVNYSLSKSDLTPGEHTYYFRAQDANSGVITTSSATVYVNEIPVITSSGNTTQSLGTFLSYHVAATDENAPSLAYHLNTNASWAALSNSYVNGTATGVGWYEFTVWANDSYGGSDSEHWHLTVADIPEDALTHYWVATTSGEADSANNWYPAFVPASGDSVIFNGGSSHVCYWNMTGAFDAFSITSGYSGKITYGAEFSVTSFLQNGGEFDGSALYSLIDYGDFIQSDGTLTYGSVILKMCGDGSTLLTQPGTALRQLRIDYGAHVTLGSDQNVTNFIVDDGLLQQNGHEIYVISDLETVLWLNGKFDGDIILSGSAESYTGFVTVPMEGYIGVSTPLNLIFERYFNVTAIVGGGSVLLKVKVWTGDPLIYNASAGTGEITNISFEATGCIPSAYYKLLVDGVFYRGFYSDAYGRMTWWYDGEWSEHEFTLQDPPDSHYWDGEGADALFSNDLNWAVCGGANDVEPTAGDNIYFWDWDDSCTWDVAVTVGNIAITANYTGTITQGAVDFGYADFSMAGGVWTGVVGSSQVCSGDFTQTSGTITDYSVTLHMTGDGKTYSASTWIRYVDFYCENNITVTGSGGGFRIWNSFFSVSAGKTVTIASGKAIELLNDATSSILGTVSGPGTLMRSFSTSTNFEGGNLDCLVLVVHNNIAGDATLTLTGAITGSSTITVSSYHITATGTLALNGNTVSLASLTLGDRGILSGAGFVDVSGTVTINGAGSCYYNGTGILECDNLTITLGTFYQRNTVWINGTGFYQNGGTFYQDNGARWMYVSSNFRQVAPGAIGWCYPNVALTGTGYIGLTGYSTILMCLDITGTYTTLSSFTADAVFHVHGTLNIASGHILSFLTMHPGTDFQTPGSINGPGTLSLCPQTYDINWNPSGTLGNNILITIIKAGWGAANLKVTLQGNLNCYYTYIYSTLPGSTCTLDLAGYDFSATNVQIGTLGSITSTIDGSNITCTGLYLNNTNPVLTQGAGIGLTLNCNLYVNAGYVNESGNFILNGNYAHAGGILYGSLSSYFTCSGDWVQTGGSGVQFSVNLIMTGDGKVLACTNIALRTIRASANISMYDFQLYGLTVDAGKTVTLTTGVSQLITWGAVFVYSNLGIITGTGTLDIQLAIADKSFDLGILNCPLLIQQENGGSSSKFTFIANTVLGSTLTINSQSATLTMTVDLNGFSLSCADLIAGTRSVVASSITGAIITTTGSITVLATGQLNAMGIFWITCGGNWDSSAGSFVEGTSLVDMTGAGKTIKLALGDMFCDLLISGSDTLLSHVVVMNKMWIPGDLTQGIYRVNVTSGISNSLYINGTFDGDIYLDGAATSHIPWVTLPMGGTVHANKPAVFYFTFGSVKVDPTAWANTTLKGYNITTFSWFSGCNVPGTNVTFTLNNLLPLSDYAVYCDGVFTGQFVSTNGAGTGTFYHTSWTVHFFAGGGFSAPSLSVLEQTVYSYVAETMEVAWGWNLDTNFSLLSLVVIDATHANISSTAIINNTFSLEYFYVNVSCITPSGALYINYTLTVINVAPVFLTTPVLFCDVGFWYVYDSDTDQEGQGVVYTLNGHPWFSINSNTGRVHGRMPNVPSLSLEILANDGHGGITSQSWVLTTNVMNAYMHLEIKYTVGFFYMVKFELIIDDNSSINASFVQKIRWNLGDGVGSRDYAPVHKYAGAGIYQVSVEVTDIFGRVGHANLQIAVEMETPESFAWRTAWGAVQFFAISLSACSGLLLGGWLGEKGRWKKRRQWALAILFGSVMAITVFLWLEVVALYYLGGPFG